MPALFFEEFLRRPRLAAQAALIGALASAMPCWAAPQASAQMRLVESLYRDFAYEAVLDSPSASASTLITLPERAVSRYFSQRLARLLVRDRACTVARRDACRLDFMPIWASQDPAGATVKIMPGDASSVVSVRIRYGATERRLSYRLVREASGWRINDIAYDDDRNSLAAILETKP